MMGYFCGLVSRASTSERRNSKRVFSSKGFFSLTGVSLPASIQRRTVMWPTFRSLAAAGIVINSFLSAVTQSLFQLSFSYQVTISPLYQVNTCIAMVIWYNSNIGIREFSKKI